MFTGPIYGWKGSQNGVLLGVLGIASIPISFLVGYISPHVSDRLLTLAAVIVTTLGAVLCTQAGLRKMAVAYFGGGGMLYLVSCPSYAPQDPSRLVSRYSWSSVIDVTSDSRAFARLLCSELVPQCAAGRKASPCVRSHVYS